MAGRAIAMRRDPYELLERMLNETSLTTKRASHNHIIDVGDLLMKQSNVDLEGIKQKAVDIALKEAEKRHSRELRAALKRLEKNLLQDKEHALERQKRYYEQLARRVAEQRDKAEEERIRELRKLCEAEKAAALRVQWEEAERLRAEAVRAACEALTTKLKNEFALEKELAIAEALAKARDQFRIREQASIARTRRECEAEAAEAMARVREQHSQEISKHKRHYAALLHKYNQEVEHRHAVERDFKMALQIAQDLQDDYQRFMNYTDGHFNSEYMMYLRSHGLEEAKKRLATPVRYEDIEPLL